MAEDAGVDLYAACEHRVFPPRLLLREASERNPEGERNLGAQFHRFAAGDDRDVGPDDNCRQPHRPRPQVVENADHYPFPRQIDSRFLASFPDCGFLQRSVTTLLASARKCDLSTPWIAGIFRALDEEQLRRSVLARAKDQGDR